MDKDQQLTQLKRLYGDVMQARTEASAIGVYAEVKEFFRRYVGVNTSFYDVLTKINLERGGPSYHCAILNSVIDSYQEYLKAGLDVGVSIERRAQLEVVSDYLEMAQKLLDDRTVHPAAPTMLIGATLEEFLRTWVENDKLSLNNRKPSLDTYSQVLREADLITKQDAKDITSWAGLRNHAAHGEWDLISDRQRISIMLESVNLFIRQHQ